MMRHGFLVLSVFLFTCCSYLDRDCSQFFMDFSEMRLTVYFNQQKTDSSYLDYENWKSYYRSQDRTTKEIDLKIYPKDSWSYAVYYPESSDFYSFHTRDSIFLDFGNGDIDTVLFLRLGFSSFDCYDPYWIDKVWINGDSLSRDTDKSFKYSKK